MTDKTDKTTQMAIDLAKQEYEATIKAAKAKFDEIKKQNEKPGPGLFGTISNGIDNVALWFDKISFRHCEAITYKRENPEGYKADQVITTAVDIINSLWKKKENKKDLTPRDIAVLSNLATSLGKIGASQVRCNKRELVYETLESIFNLLQAQSIFECDAVPETVDPTPDVYKVPVLAEILG